MKIAYTKNAELFKKNSEKLTKRYGQLTEPVSPNVSLRTLCIRRLKIIVRGFGHVGELGWMVCWRVGLESQSMVPKGECPSATGHELFLRFITAWIADLFLLKGIKIFLLIMDMTIISWVFFTFDRIKIQVCELQVRQPSS